MAIILKGLCGQTEGMSKKEGRMEDELGTREVSQMRLKHLKAAGFNQIVSGEDEEKRKKKSD